MKKTRKKQTAASPQEMPESMAALAYGMVDDFNNILTTLMGACSLIDKDDSANSELLRYMAVIRASAERAAALSERLMRASTLERRKDQSGAHPPDTATVKTSGRDKKNIHDIVSTF